MRLFTKLLFAAVLIVTGLWLTYLGATASGATGQGLGVFGGYPIVVEVLVDGRASSEPRLVAAYYTLKQFATATPATVDGWAYQATVRARAREWCHAVVFAPSRKEHKVALALLEAQAKAAEDYLRGRTARDNQNNTGVAPP